MSKKTIHVLQVGQNDWSQQYDIPESLAWHWIRPEEIPHFIEEDTELRERNKKLRQKELPVEKKEVTYSALLLTEHQLDANLSVMDYLIQPYEVFYSQSLDQQALSADNKRFLKQKLAYAVDDSAPQHLINRLSKRLFIGQYGDKLHVNDLEVADWFSGEKINEGRRYLKLSGDFTSDFRPIAQFRYNIPIAESTPLKLWLEYVKSDAVELKIKLVLFPSGATSEIAKEWLIEGSQFEQPIEIETPVDGVFSVSILAKGQGELKIGPFHYRFSRGDWGEFILGGKRSVDSERRELFTYFNPGDFKPPLNVYFSGWRPAEGYEGFWMMKSLGAPFLLVVDPRFDGGAFYLGGEELESAVVDRIQEALEFLGFSNEELILSGISMGSFGALYYGASLEPHAIIVGKPLVNLGDMAENERLNRPNGFPTSLDLLQAQEGNLEETSALALNQHFWGRFLSASLDKTLLAMSYMKQDDYDDKAFHQLVSASQKTNWKVIGKGFLGRHNDNSQAINQWFIKQFNRILETDFGRK